MPSDFLRHVRACNRWDPAGFLPFRVDGARMGSLRPAFAGHLRQWPELFRVESAGVTLTAQGDFAARSAAVGAVQRELVAQGVIPRLHDELFGVTPGGPEQAVLALDRACAAHYGIRSFGQHVNGYVREGERLRMWIARRARDRIHYPGKLDNLAAGGLPWGIGLHDNLLKECAEEAGIAPELAGRARPVGALTYTLENERGFKPDTLYCYDLELPPDFRPECTDGEVEEFYLLPLEEVMELVATGDEFKLNCNLVLIDFLIRRGYIRPEHPQYLQLTAGLHAPPCW